MLSLVAAAALAGCAGPSEGQRAAAQWMRDHPQEAAQTTNTGQAEAIRDLTEQLNNFGKDFPRTRTTNCYRTVSGASCTTY